MRRSDGVFALEHDTPAADVRELALKRLDLLRAQGNRQVHANGREGFFLNQTVEFGQAQLDQRQFAEAAVKIQGNAIDQCSTLCLLQAFVRAAAIGPCQSTGPQLNAAVPANDQHNDLIKILRFDSRENRPARRATGLAVVGAADCAPSFQAQQLCVALRSLFCSMNA